MSPLVCAFLIVICFVKTNILVLVICFKTNILVAIAFDFVWADLIFSLSVLVLMPSFPGPTLHLLLDALPDVTDCWSYDDARNAATEMIRTLRWLAGLSRVNKVSELLERATRCYLCATYAGLLLTSPRCNSS